MAGNVGIEQGADLKLSTDEVLTHGETAHRQLIGESYGYVGTGRKTIAVAGTREALSVTSICRKVTITAELDNTGVIVVGGPFVVASLATRQGTPLEAGDSVTLEVLDLALIYLDTTVNGDGVTYTYLV